MRLIPASLLVGAAVLGLGAFAHPAAGKDPAVHQMTIQLPGGSTETIRYTGEAAPKSAPVAFRFEPTSAAFDRIAADMDRQMDALWQQAATLQNWSHGGDL